MDIRITPDIASGIVDVEMDIAHSVLHAAYTMPYLVKLYLVDSETGGHGGTVKPGTQDIHTYIYIYNIIFNIYIST